MAHRNTILRALCIIVTLGLIYPTSAWSQTKQKEGELLYKEITAQKGIISDDLIISKALTYLKNGHRLRRLQVHSHLAQAYDRKQMTEEALSVYSTIWQKATGAVSHSIPAISRASDILWERNRAQEGNKPSDRQLAAQSLHDFLKKTHKLYSKFSKAEQKSWTDLESKYLKFKEESDFDPNIPSKPQQAPSNELKILLDRVSHKNFDWHGTYRWLDTAEGKKGLDAYQKNYSDLDRKLKKVSLKRLVYCNHLSTIPLLSSLLRDGFSSQEDVLQHLDDYLEIGLLNPKFGMALAPSIAPLAIPIQPKKIEHYLSCLAFAIMPSMDLNLAKKSLAKIDENSSPNLIGSIYVGFNRASAALPDRFLSKSLQEWENYHPKSDPPPARGPHAFFLRNYLTSAYDEAWVALARNNPKAALAKLEDLDPKKDFFQSHGEIYLAAYGLPNRKMLTNEISEIISKNQPNIPSELHSYYLTPILLKDVDSGRAGRLYSGFNQQTRSRVAEYMTIPVPQDCGQLFQELRAIYKGEHPRQTDLNSPQSISSYFEKAKDTDDWYQKGHPDRFQNFMDIYAAKNAQKFIPYVKHLVH